MIHEAKTKKTNCHDSNWIWKENFYVFNIRLRLRSYSKYARVKNLLPISKYPEAPLKRSAFASYVYNLRELNFLFDITSCITKPEY